MHIPCFVFVFVLEKYCSALFLYFLLTVSNSYYFRTLPDDKRTWVFLFKRKLVNRQNLNNLHVKRIDDTLIYLNKASSFRDRARLPLAVYVLSYGTVVADLNCCIQCLYVVLGKANLSSSNIPHLIY